MANLTTLTTTNAEMTDRIEKLIVENWQIQQQLNIFQKKLPHDDSHGAAGCQPAVGSDKKIVS